MKNWYHAGFFSQVTEFPIIPIAKEKLVDTNATGEFQSIVFIFFFEVANVWSHDVIARCCN